MSNFQFPYNQGQVPGQFNSLRQIQDMFPQPQGSVYAIQTAAEIGNVPIGSTGLSVAICFPEQVMYIKSFQNGNPIIMAYRVVPYSKENSENIASAPTKETASTEERLTKLEQQLTSFLSQNGGKFDGLL